ncbi:sensor domain-containing diguanylate cyclase [Vibrio zhanjiangensis]|uniref:diguanylate cyclase n=1 Tax=Vibrio zhanjiangensis TaxID=1046128 RepID=A0ABQ6EVJ6_9VIBR|nr:sensor domain-containing diguanylate cyclase [Vibrio zhanjiangensis]GLT17039.1 sensor domain-containing diguanylate cyclase [Vibrio zhanjiangensis]
MGRVTLLICILFFSADLLAKQAEPELRPLIVTNSKAWKPFSYLDDDQQPAGILIDYWKLFAKHNNIEIEFLLLDWNESLEAVKTGKADIHAGLLWSERREAYLDYTPSIITIDTQMYISRDLIGLDLNNFMLGNHEYSVGVVMGGYEEEFTRKNYPNLTLAVFSNNQKMIDAAFKGEISAFVADLQVGNFYLLTSNRTNAFVGVRNLYSGDLRAAVKEGNKTLQELVIKGQDAITESEKKRILSRWMHINTVYPTFLAPALIVIALFGVILYIFALRYSVRMKTRELAKANEELKKLSETDYLTGLSNRRHFVAEFQKHLDNSGDLCVMVFDIDDFKMINDTYGHQVGDDVIKTVAKTIQACVGSDQLLGRIGGEEFALVMNDQDELRVQELSHAICDLVRNIDFGGQPPYKVTLSLGCAYYPSAHNEIQLSDADHLMYQAKAQGKDRAVVCNMAREQCL